MHLWLKDPAVSNLNPRAPSTAHRAETHKQPQFEQKKLIMLQLNRNVLVLSSLEMSSFGRSVHVVDCSDELVFTTL